jgi:hypothetical protein
MSNDNLTFFEKTHGQWERIFNEFVADPKFLLAMQNAGKHNFHCLSFSVRLSDWLHPITKPFLFLVSLLHNIAFNNFIINNFNAQWILNNVKAMKSIL